MNKIKLLIIFALIAIFLSGCSLKKQISVYANYPPTEGDIPIIMTNQPLPRNIVRIGSIDVGDSGLTSTCKCTYEACIKAIEDGGRLSGAQIIYIVRITEPNRYSTCYNITAELYRYK